MHILHEPGGDTVTAEFTFDVFLLVLINGPCLVLFCILNHKFLTSSGKIQIFEEITTNENILIPSIISYSLKLTPSESDHIIY